MQRREARRFIDTKRDRVETPLAYDDRPMSAARESPLTRADVVHVANLARLALSDDELDRLTTELAGILAHAQDIAALDLSGLPPTSHPLPLVNVFRPDQVRPGADRSEVLAMAPAAESGRFRVPKILGES